jgi:cytochrome P450
MPDYHPFSEAVYDDPYPCYRRLRDEAPAFYLAEFDCWFLSRFEDIWQRLQDQTPLTSRFGTTTTHLLTKQTPTAPNLSSYDGAEHARIRGYFSPFFLPGNVRRLEPLVRELAQDAVARVAERGECDAVADLGGRVSVRVASTILGLPLEDADQVLEWVNTYFEREPGQRGSTKRGIESSKDFAIYLHGISKRARERGAPAGSVLEKLLTTELEGERLDDRRIAAHLHMMAIGGTETFPKVFSALLYRLWQHPEQRARVAADPSLAPDALQEALRYDMPTQMLGRTIASDFELHGETLRAGSGLCFLWASANRDEREFPDPDRFDIGRRAPRILSFGAGAHMCLGVHVARLEGRLLLEELLARWPEYAVDEAGIARLRSEFFRGFAKLPLRARP